MVPRAVPDPDDIAARVIRGEERALARLLTALEDGEPWSGAALRKLRQGARLNAPAHVIGVTGPPGSGKSTLVDKLISVYRERGERVAVLAVDPSSPFSGGAILGDRIRMQARRRPGAEGSRAAGIDEGVFIRSLASRGRLGGLSRASAQCARALEAAGYGLVLIETVGIGQSEVDIARLADTVLLVSMPGSGDDIQTIKAGVMEIGDIFVVNKSDREGADRAVREIASMLEMGAALATAAALGGIQDHRDYERARAAAAADIAAALPPVLKTVAETGEGVGELAAALDARWAKLAPSEELEAKRRRGAMAEARALLSERVLAELEALEGGLEEGLAAQIVRGEAEVGEAADLLFDSIRKGGGE
jgi:LAO/AO transport system kinase